MHEEAAIAEPRCTRRYIAIYCHAVPAAIPLFFAKEEIPMVAAEIASLRVETPTNEFYTLKVNYRQLYRMGDKLTELEPHVILGNWRGQR
jgi:hypothetical protein